MPRITRITPQATNPERLNIFIDNGFCTGVRLRTFQGMNLKVGDELSCDDLKEKESFFWKQSNQAAGTWENEKARIDKVAAKIKNISDHILLTIVGFGADSTVLIKEHPDEKGKPDIDISHKKQPEKTLIKLEVTGTEYMRGTDYWIRPDKLEYAENHPNEDVWIALHFMSPTELFIFIKPIKGKSYERVQKNIRGAGEIYCVFNDGDEEVKTVEYFSEYINAILEKAN